MKKHVKHKVAPHHPKSLACHHPPHHPPQSRRPRCRERPNKHRSCLDERWWRSRTSRLLRSATTHGPFTALSGSSGLVTTAPMDFRASPHRHKERASLGLALGWRGSFRDLDAFELLMTELRGWSLSGRRRLPAERVPPHLGRILEKKKKK